MSLVISDVSFAYQAGSPLVLDGLSFTSEYGEITAIIGRNGAGKSTIFKLILGMLPHFTGEITIDQQAVAEISVEDRAKKMAWIPQKSGSAFPYTVYEMVLMGTNAALGFFGQPGKQEDKIVKKVLEQVGISAFAKRRYDELSGGEQQLVLIARALAQNSKMLLLDEPCTALDLGHQHKVMSILRDLAAQGYMIVLSTHNPQQAFYWVDQVILLSEGVVQAKGAPCEVLTAESLSELYEIPVQVVEVPEHGVFIYSK